MALSTNLLAYYRCDEDGDGSVLSAGETIVDSSGNGFHMTVIAAPNSPDVNDSGVSQSHTYLSGDWAACSSPSEARPLLTQGFTAQIVFALQNKAASYPIFTRWDDTSADGKEWAIWYFNGSDNVVFNYYDGADKNILGQFAPTQGAYLHTVIRHDPDSDYVALTLNGGSTTSQAHTGGIVNGTATAKLNLASWISGASRAFGSVAVDEAAIWERVLSDEEVSASYSLWVSRVGIIDTSTAAADGDGSLGPGGRSHVRHTLIRRWI